MTIDNIQPNPPPPYSKAPPTTSTNTSDIVQAAAVSSPPPTLPLSPSANSDPSLLHHQSSLQQLAHYQQQQQQKQSSHVQSDLVSAAQALTSLTKNASSPSSDLETIVTTDDLDTTASHDFATTASGEAQSQSQREREREREEEEEAELPQQRHPLVSTVSMVAKHPVVMNAVKYYETSKRNYPSFNYAAGIVEAAAIPVVTKIEDNLNTRHQHQSRKPSSTDMTPVSSFDNKQLQCEPRPQKQKKRRYSNSSSMSTTSITPSTYDVKKRLQFCICILKAANANINSKINFLQTKINETEMAVKEERYKLQNEAQQQQQQQQQQQYSTSDEATQKTKSEIVGTVKKIIHLISNFRPSALSQPPASPVVPPAATPTPTPTAITPEDSDYNTSNTLTPTSSQHSSCIQDYELKNTIRDIILHLPASLQRSTNHQRNDSGDYTSADGNDRVFAFAKESLDMITKLTNVFSEQLERVESWVTGVEGEEGQHLQLSGINEKEEDSGNAEMREEKSDGSFSTRCSSEEPDGLTSATKRMRIDELVS
ncbi:OPI1 [Candida oxycetoniae]|uniref:OPI1 n=1 Tax=Candida oxycetoniae TaxID=497107 RepID=A0AAI9SU81_9ASCO|nr:OPI1 [Candida oxycetoniae]KAI3402758.2 OPI1 [Candida oxycetoniae]